MRPFFRDLIYKRGGIFPQDALELSARRIDGRGDKKLLSPSSPIATRRARFFFISYLILYGNIIVYHDTYNISMMVKL